ncbi:arsenate reductase (glutaredoxin) [Lysobacter sp. A03]|uniref:arsenate reductase (glutaredoxin) n=1 Tax=Lysobacter sp. A03 TaxID=1199154 RepID=UPI0005B6FCC7|nr:arsenate reductase (glutaredoxin) [Lysobacter sp. A03]KIQ96305.1 Arsenate reductase [Lysobacter sp. A03]
MKNTRIYHNPRCSKSRGTLELLQENSIQPEVILYLDNPPDADELRSLLSMLDMPPRALLRTGESEYAELGLADPGKSDDEIVEAMAAHPRLIERPIFVHNGRAVIGRPPENVLRIL